MSQSKWIVRLAALVAVTGACSSEEAKTANDKMIVQGTVSQQLYSTDVAAVALGVDGRTFWSALDAKGDFKLTVPAGQSYRIVLAKRALDGKPTAVAQLALTSANGKTQWVTAKAGAVLRLGDLVPAGTLTSTTIATGGLKPATSGRGGTDLSDDGSGRGGSGRGGSGRGGRGGDDAHDTDDDGDDAFEDDEKHCDDPESQEVEHEAGNVCAATSPEMVSTRNAADDVKESCDFGGHEAGDDDACTAAPSASTSTAPAPADTTSADTAPADTAVPAESPIE